LYYDLLKILGNLQRQYDFRLVLNGDEVLQFDNIEKETSISGGRYPNTSMVCDNRLDGNHSEVYLFYMENLIYFFVFADSQLQSVWEWKRK
jgi:hypothetical protein